MFWPADGSIIGVPEHVALQILTYYMKTFVTDDTLLTFVCQCKLPNLIIMYCNHCLYSNHSTSYV